LQNVFDVVGRHDSVGQFAIEIVKREIFLVAAQFEQALHHVVAILVFYTTHVITRSL
jgi:hypothetical protein